jgi:hypothetical protein
MPILAMLWAVMFTNGIFVGLNASIPFLGVASAILFVMGLIMAGVFNRYEGGIEAWFFGGMCGFAIAGSWFGYLVHHLHFVS